MDSCNNFDNFNGLAQELWKIWRRNFDKTTRSSGEFGAGTLKSYTVISFDHGASYPTRMSYGRVIKPAARPF